MHPDDVERVRAIDEETTRTGDPYRAEYRAICKDGSIRWVRDEAVLIRNDDGEPLFWLGFLLDITDLKLAEFEATEALESLQAANDELARVSKAKSEIVSLISHEFRTPLTSIQGYSELLVDETLSFDEVRQFATTINTNARRLTRMIGDMLDIDRLESGRTELRWQNVDLNEVVDDVVDNVRLTSPHHTFESRLDPTLPLIHGDLDLLIRVVTNLVANAVKYSPAGGEITLTTSQTTDAVELTVADQGLGIPDEALESIFARYTRISRPEQANIDGTGLGLPIAREIVSLHNGSIWAEHGQAGGSVFHVVLPK
jgi:signal transduction histidine kinase